jgi:sulfatase maturation enzyme AslB (radical SAM superfamily)
MPHPMTRQSSSPGSASRIVPGLTNGHGSGEEPSPEKACRGVPAQPFLGLDVLWVQVAGTLCNLSCTHCFVPSGPHETRHAMLSRAEVQARVAEAIAMGVREVYLTGGEPFLHPAIEGIVEDTLVHAPVTILTNGTLLTERRVAWLAALTRESRYALELRVSLDGVDEATHDAFRGAGAWRRALDGLRALRAVGLEPIVTLTRPMSADANELAARARTVLEREGVPRARLKLIPLFVLGREAKRSGSAPAPASLATLPAEAFDPERLQCGSCRAVTSRGVFVCPLLVDEPAARMGDSLADAARPFALAHSACATCWATGMTCANE